MNSSVKNVLLFAVMAGLIVFVGQYQSWNLALSILNLCIISAIMSLGVNIQWGYAGLFNVGVMGFAALGGLAAMIISVSPVPEAWSAGGVGVLIALFILVATIVAAVFGYRKMSASPIRSLLIGIICVGGYFLLRTVADPATTAIEKVNPASTGYLGG